ncbi:aldehyde dehydrogenase family protein [Nocardia sp. NPDC127579]|uniref:aldehyde dehydrogenase family protein n=1 Tax=Nocardia sp. NPDC127579 TaxID=3345402 RepID=UPI00362597F7
MGHNHRGRAAAAGVAVTVERAAWLRAAASALEHAAGELVPLAARETRLPELPRLHAELDRTAFQLRLFGHTLTDGEFLCATVDHADPHWEMGARPDLRRMVVPIGPVLVFAAGNFPFALSVAGHDTAAALAAGCPVVVKAHPGHPELSVRTGEILVDALTWAGAPPNIVAVICETEAGVAALRHEEIAAASFTGSVAGGRALFDIAAARPRPIPFYGELGSLNPVLVTPGAVRARGPEIAAGYVSSFTLGAGQFCTKPGLLLLPEGHGLTGTLRAAVAATHGQPMLDDRIAEGYHATLAGLRDDPATEVISAPDAVADTVEPTLLRVTADEFVAAAPQLRTECFGPSSLIVEYTDTTSIHRVLAALEPALTATIHAEDTEYDTIRPLLPTLTRLAGRLVWNGWPTGITLTWAQQHGGPYPATTTTSMGPAAIDRVLRPVAWQEFPDALLPPALRDANPWDLLRRIDGKR